MLRFCILMIAFLVSACDASSEQTLDRLSGREVNLVILAKQPVLLTPEAKSFISQEPMKVVGEMALLCFALRGGVPHQDSKAMNRTFQASMQNARIKVVVVLSNGDRIDLFPPLQSWKLNGRIIKNDELSACAGTPCISDLPPGSQVAKIEVSSEPSLQVQGVYWESERGPLEETTAPAATAATSATKGKSPCVVARA